MSNTTPTWRDGNDPSLTLSADAFARAEQRLTPAQKSAVARVLGSRIGAGDLSAEEEATVITIVRLLARDAVVEVRKALAETLAENRLIPRDLAVSIASDTDVIAVPFLEACEALAPADLVAIVQASQSMAKLMAIARRGDVGEEVSLALVRHGDAGVALTLAGNAGAALGEPALNLILDRHGKLDAIQERLTARAMLPARIVARMISTFSDVLVKRLMERHPVPSDLAVQVGLETKERGTIGLATGLSPAARDGLIADLAIEGRITASLLLRSVSVGNFEFFSYALAAKVQASPSYVASRVLETESDGLHRIWKQASLSEEEFPFVRAAINVMLRSREESAKWDVDRYRSRMIDRILTEYDALGLDIGDEDADFVIDQRDKNVADGVQDFGPGANPPPTS